MERLTWLLRVVGGIQLILGLLYLAAPGSLLEAMGHTAPAADLFYPLAMLAARFLVYGGALIYISRTPLEHRLWVDGMILIQLIDLSAGLFYTASGVVAVTLSGIPMFNALWIAVLLLWWRPGSASQSSRSRHRPVPS
jgi:hypothetical protein